MAVTVGFSGDIISCELARRDERRVAAEAGGSGGLQRVSALTGLTQIFH